MLHACACCCMRCDVRWVCLHSNVAVSRNIMPASCAGHRCKHSICSGDQQHHWGRLPGALLRDPVALYSVSARVYLGRARWLHQRSLQLEQSMTPPCFVHVRSYKIRLVSPTVTVKPPVSEPSKDTAHIQQSTVAPKLLEMFWHKAAYSLRIPCNKEHPFLPAS